MPDISLDKIRKRINEINMKIIDLELVIQNAKGELSDFRNERDELYGLLEELTDERQRVFHKLDNDANSESTKY